MVKNSKILQEFMNTLSRKEGPLPFSHSLKLFTSMWLEGISLGVLPPKTPLEGIETDIKIAGVLNSCLKNCSQK
jgi:hypothetical protein